ncbi:riboflavin synthase [Haloarcula laminariae]|uniref:riboflavin synthase n=1 Tax=Haloarcula laminariae TaxID=2961577 RepID=UPI0021C9BC94|nr:riboflavin synthase [Halomicroarcula laminariae]
MFTGIVEATGEVLAVTDDDGGRRIRVGTPFTDLSHGQSISISGACLTVEEFADGEWAEFFLARETLAKTFFDGLEVSDRVNLERAMPADGRFDGHIVQGHVDATAEVVGIEREGDVPASEASGSSSSERSEYDGDWTFSFSLPEGQREYLVEKGSITVDGISLTVAARGDDRFDVAIIPTTYRETALSEKSVGDPVHLEVDVVAKYVEQLC